MVQVKPHEGRRSRRMAATGMVSWWTGARLAEDMMADMGAEPGGLGWQRVWRCRGGVCAGDAEASSHSHAAAAAV